MIIKQKTNELINNIPKIIITMTTWTKRINSAEKIIEYIIDNISGFDKLYLFLTKTEFEDLSKLPEKIQKFHNEKRIECVFLDKNYFAFKRWFVYPKHYDDIVISIDDDVYTPKDIIEQAKRCYLKTPEKTVYNLYDNLGGVFNINDNDITVKYGEYKGKTYSYNKLYFFAQCIIMPKTFNLDIFNYNEIQQKLAPYDDESWITYFLLKNNVKIDTLHYDFFNIPKIKDSSLSNASWIKLSRKCINFNINTRSLQFYIILRYFNYLDEFKKNNIYYNTNKYDKISLDDLIDEYMSTTALPVDFNSTKKEIFYFDELKSLKDIYNDNINNMFL